MKVNKVCTQYKITDHYLSEVYTHKLRIFAEVSEKGITVKTCEGCTEFEFINSDPEKIQHIGKMIARAGKLKE